MIRIENLFDTIWDY